MLCAVLALSACGSVDSSAGGGDATGGSGADAASTGIPCPAEDYTLVGADGVCNSTDLYTVSMASNSLKTESVQGTCTGGVSRCKSMHVVANGYASPDGVCTFTRTDIETDEAGDCTATIVSTCTADYATLQANIDPSHPTH